MENSNYLPTMDEFLLERPDIDPALKSVIEPAVADSQQAVYQFIISYIFM